MPTYAILGNYTQQGIAAVKDQAPAGLEAGKRAIEHAGGELKGFYLLMGLCRPKNPSASHSDVAYQMRMGFCAPTTYLAAENRFEPGGWNFVPVVFQNPIGLV